MPKTNELTKREEKRTLDDRKGESSSRKVSSRGKDRYFQGVGRRKTAVARVKLFTRGDRVITVNGRPFSVYFPTEPLREIAKAALTKMNVDGKFRVVVSVEGGGLHAQAEAMRHGTARALLQFNPDFRKRLKRAGYLTRDPRMVERKKPGRKKARRMPQWSKR